MDPPSKDGRGLTQRSFVGLNLLPLSYDREIKDLTFFFKAMYGYYDLNIFYYVSFVTIAVAVIV